MRRYTSTTRVTKDGSFDFFDKSDDGELCRFEDVQALAKEVLPYLQHTHRDCEVEGVETTECFCQLFTVRDKLKAIIEATP